MAKKIKVALDLEQKLPLHYLTPLQGELKKLTDERKEKLKASILKHGFSFPFFVWENPEDAKIYIIDGHQRFQVLTDLKSEKYIVPQLPVVFIQAKDLKDAKSKLLAAASQYGEFTPEGIHDFTIDLDMGDIGEFAEIPFLSLPEVLEADEGLPTQETVTVSEHERAKTGKVDLEDYEKFAHRCPKCSHEFN